MSEASSLIRRARLFHFHAKYLWRFHRLMVGRHLSGRCVRCVISEACTPLDDHGVCADCRAFEQARPGSEREDTQRPSQLALDLDRLLHEHEGKAAGAYDGLVMLSGGKDSALLVHELRQRYPRLRLLTLTVDNNFMSPVALTNLRQVVAKLDVDHVMLRPAISLWKKSFRFACTLADKGKGCFETADRMDADLSFSLAKIYAAENRIPLIVTGLSWAQVERMFNVSSFEIPADVTLARTTSVLGHPLEKVYGPEELRYWWNPGNYASDRWPRFIHPYYVWRHSEEYIFDEVVKLGLIRRGNDSPLVTNNVIIPIMVVIDFLRLGYASYEPEFAAQVRSGKASGPFWRNVFEMLEYSAKTGWMLDKEIGKIANALGLTPAEIGLDRR